MRDTSAYRIDGVRLPSVTEILTIAGLSDWSMVPSSVLEEARARGSEIHLWLEMFDRGYLKDGDEPAEAIAPYVAAYHKFRAEVDFEIGEIEVVVLNAPHRYAGTVDRTGTLNGKAAIVDFKSGAPVPTTPLQLAGYEACFPERLERYELHLRQDGNFRLLHHRSRNDKHDFLAAARVAHWKLAHHGGTLE